MHEPDVLLMSAQSAGRTEPEMAAGLAAAPRIPGRLAISRVRAEPCQVRQCSGPAIRGRRLTGGRHECASAGRLMNVTCRFHYRPRLRSWAYRFSRALLRHDSEIRRLDVFQRAGDSYSSAAAM